MRMALWALLLLQAPPVPPQVVPSDPSVRGVIQGVVKSLTSSEGIPDVEITLAGVSTAPGANTPQLTKTTDASGRFSFTGVPGGRYTIRAEREGYFPATSPGAVPPAGALASIATATAATITKDVLKADVMINLVPGGVISGQVRDQQGKPAAGVPLVVLRAAYQDGRRTLRVVNTSTGFSASNSNHSTSDRGDYRIFWLPPGEYYVRSDVSNGVVSRETSATTIPQITYFPGTSDVSRALTVKVRPGEEVAAIDFTMEYARAFAVSGKVTVPITGGRTLPNGQISRGLGSFFVVPQNADPGERIPLTSAQTSSTDQIEFDFEVRGLAPGAYYLFPLFATDQQPGAPNGVGAMYYSTRIPVELVDHDVTGLRGVIQRNPDVTVRVTLNGDPPVGIRIPMPPRVQLRPQEALGSLIATPSMRAAQVKPDGTTVYPSLFPTRYKVQLATPAGYYLAGMRQGSTDLYNDGILTVTPDLSDPVEITFSSRGGEIRGIVRDSEGKPVTASVELIPEGPRRSNSLLYRGGTASATTGEFRIADIAPGEYKLFAWQTNTAGADQNAEYLARYEARGRSITVQSGLKVGDITLEVIRNEAP
jgi:hypothetical protein